MSGQTSWYIIDGYRPPTEKGGADDYRGHECIMILNCNDEDAHIELDVYFPDREPVIGIPYVVPARRVRAFHTDDQTVMGDLDLGIGNQYSLNIRSDVGVIVQYGRLDINQDNMAYMATLGYPG